MIFSLNGCGDDDECKNDDDCDVGYYCSDWNVKSCKKRPGEGDECRNPYNGYTEVCTDGLQCDCEDGLVCKYVTPPNNPSTYKRWT